MWTLSLSYSNFRKDSNFEIHLFVLDLETTNMTHFSEVLAMSKTQAPKVKIWDSSI